MRRILASLGITFGLVFAGSTVPIIPFTEQCPHAYTQLYYDTASGLPEEGQFGLDETQTRYLVNTGTGPTYYEIGTIDVSALSQVQLLGTRPRKDCIDSRGDVVTHDMTLEDYSAIQSGTSIPSESVLLPVLDPLIANAASPSVVTGSDTGMLSGAVAATSDSFSVTVSASGQNTIFFGMFGHGGGGNLQTATLNGQTMTRVTYVINQQYVAYAYIKTSTSGTGSGITWTMGYPFSASGRWYRGLTIQDVDQTTQVDTSSNNSCGGCTSVSSAITTTVPNTMVWSIIHGGSTHTNTWSATDYADDELSVGGDGANSSASYKEQTSAGLITPSYTLSSASPEMAVLALRYQAPTVTDAVLQRSTLIIKGLLYLGNAKLLH